MDANIFQHYTTLSAENESRRGVKLAALPAAARRGGFQPSTFTSTGLLWRLVTGREAPTAGHRHGRITETVRTELTCLSLRAVILVCLSCSCLLSSPSYSRTTTTKKHTVSWNDHFVTQQWNFTPRMTGFFFFSSIKVTMREAKAAKLIILIKTGVLTGEASGV